MEKFGYKQEGTKWIMPGSRLFTVVIAVLGAVMLLIAVAIGVFGVGLGPTDGWGGRLLVLVLFGGPGLLLALSALRGRHYIDLSAQAFVWQHAFGRTVLPFSQVEKIRPIHHTQNGAYEGIHYEAIKVEENPRPGRPRPGSRVSPSFLNEEMAHEFGLALRHLLEGY